MDYPLQYHFHRLYHSCLVLLEFVNQEYFDKNHYINTCYDTGDNVGHYKCILYAKMAVEDMAKELGLSSFMLVDDDITNFRYRYPKDGKCASVKMKNMDEYTDDELTGLTDWEKDEVRKGNQDPWDFEEEDNDDDSYYGEDDD